MWNKETVNPTQHCASFIKNEGSIMDGCHRIYEISEDFCFNLQKSNCGNKKISQMLCEIILVIY